MNGFKNWNIADPEPPRGWTDSSFLVEPWTYNYYNSHWTNKVNATSEKDDISAEKGRHTTDVTEEKALSFLDDAAQREGSFFMMVAPGETLLFDLTASSS